MKIQTIIFDKNKWTEEKARAWLKENNYKSDKIDVTENSLRFRQEDPADFDDKTFRTITLTDGVKAVVAGEVEDTRELQNPFDSLRHLDAGSTTFDEDNLIVKNISLTSSEPVLEIIGDKLAYVTLRHTPEAVDISRLKNGAAFRDGHKGDQIGTILDARLDPDAGKVFIDVLFSKNNDRAILIFKDMRDRIRRNVSARSRYHEFQIIGEKDGLPLIEVTRWAIIHGALVEDPADIAVGVDREINTNKQKEKIAMAEEAKDKTQAQAPKLSEREIQEIKENLKKEVSADFKSAVDRAVSEGGEKALLEVAGIMKIAKDFKDRIKDEDLEKLAYDYAFKLKASERQFADVVMKKLAEQRPVDNFDIPEKDRNEFSLANLVFSFIDKDVKADRELEICRAYAHEKRIEPRGIVVPHTLFSERTMSAVTDSAGGYLVGTDHRADRFIPKAYPKSLVEKLGVQVWDGLVGNQAIPVQTGSATYQWLADETTGATASDLTLAQKSLTPKTVSIRSAIPRQLRLQSQPAAEELVRNDFLKLINIATNKAVFHGAGASGEPAGLDKATLALSAVKTTFTYADIIAMKTAIENSDFDAETCSFVTEPTLYGTLETTEKASGYPLYLLQDGKMAGFNVYSSTNITDGYIFFGDFSNIIVGRWGGLDIIVDPYTSSAGLLYITAFVTMDVLVRYPLSFAMYKPI